VGWGGLLVDRSHAGMSDQTKSELEAVVLERGGQRARGNA